MMPERWREIEKLYHEALELDEGRRAAFLDQACAGDEALRREIESLLAYALRAENFIESPALEVAAGILAKDRSLLETGSSLGPYQVISLVGAGGMGKVYLAQDTRLGRKVALKVLPGEFTQDPDRVRRFEQEARTASALNHPNIITIFEIGRVDNAHYIATEFIEGQTLRQQMKRSRVALGQALDIGCQIVSAIAAAHEAGVVHRDVKPENIMIRPDGYIKVLDFGIAKLTEAYAAPLDPVDVDGEAETVAALTTDTGVVMGTTSYMSPEQARGQKIDARTDLFSLGVVIYEMIAGVAPFTGPTGADVLAAILTREPLPVTSFASDMPESLDRIIAKTLRKDRAERYQSAKELLEDMRSLKQRLEFEEELKRSMGGGVMGVGRIAPAEQPSAITDPAAPRPHASQPHRVIDSLAVLPLVNTLADPGMDYFSDGITESIINLLAQLPRLRVVARSSVFRYKGLEADPQEAGRALNVEAVLAGRVRQMGDRLIIGIELIDVKNDSQLWGEHYSRNLSDVFEVQEDIAREITEKLRLKLSRKEKGRINKRHTQNVEAYQAYLKGRYFWNKRTTESLNKGIEYFKQAIDIDPAYALAYAGLSDSYTLLIVREAVSPEEGFAKAKAAAAMALKIDEEFAEAHASLGHAMLHNWEWEDAERELKRAIELNPGYPSAHHWYSEHLTAMGRRDESIAELKLAEKLDPLSLVISADLGRAFYYARQYDQVIKQEARTLEMDSSFWLSHINLGRTYTQKGMHAEAGGELEKARELSVGNTEVLSFLGFAYAVAGRRDDALKTLRELVEQSNSSHVPPYHLAIVHAGLGEKDQAFGWLERAFEKHSVDLFTLKVEPMFDGLRSDPRFEDLLGRMGLTPSETSAGHKLELEPGQSIGQAKLKAMAVLPFRPITTEGRDEYLELGLADALITKLSDINQIVVRPTSSVRKYTDLEQDCVAAGRELGVDAVLEASMQKLGDRIRVTARLVRVEDGRSLWTGKFNESFTDIFAVEDSISEKVAAALALKLTGEEKERLAKRYTENTIAYHLYLKGRYYWNKRATDALRKSIDCFYQAIEVDPNYALAYSGLADAYTFLGDVGITAMSPREAFLKGRAAATEALKIDDALAEAHASLGHLNMHNFQWADAKRELQRAIELKPNYATTHQWYAFYLIFTGSADDALKEVAHAQWLDPLSQPINADVAELLYYVGQYDRAINQYRKTLEIDPQYHRAHLNLGRVYEHLGMREEAFEEFETAQALFDSPEILAARAHAHATFGDRAEAVRLLEKLIALEKRDYVSPYDIAVIHVGLGDHDRAFEWFDKAYDERAGWMIYITVDPQLDALRSDGRYKTLVGRVGLAE